MGTPPHARKVKALRDGDPVAVTIDSGDFTTLPERHQV